MKPIERARKPLKISSNRLLAKALKESAPDHDWPANATTLATKIGEIDLGKPGWWLNRPILANALAEHLQCSLSDLGLLQPERKGLFTFPEFPELPPLDLSKESPCDLGCPISQNNRHDDTLDLWLGKDAGYGNLRRPPAGVYWLHIPEGRGRDLFWEHLQHSSAHECLSAPSIADATHRLKKRELLILNVENDSGEKDIYALADRHPAAAVLVISPYPAPILHQIDFLYSWERTSASGVERRRLELLTPDGFEMTRHEWSLHNNWQDRLLNWVELRLNQSSRDTLFTAEGARSWLSGFPFLRQIVTTPGELLALCRLCHFMPDTRLPRIEAHNAGTFLLENIHGSSAVQEQQFGRLIKAYWAEVALPWNSRLTRHQWEALTDISPHPDLDKEIQEIISSQDTAERIKLGRNLSKKVAYVKSKKPIDIDGLVIHNLLINKKSGSLSPSPQFLANLLARDHLIQKIKKDSIDSWAQYGFDDTRRPVLDAALDAITIDALIPVAEQLYKRPKTDIAAIAASEALFFAIGKHIAAARDIPDRLHGIASLILERSSASSSPSPWSRPFMPGTKSQIEWQTACWSWSLHPRPARIKLNENWAWWFPGWAKTLTHSQYTGSTLDCPDNDPLHPEQWNELISLTRDVAKKMSSYAGNNVPEFLKPALLAEAAIGGRPIDVSLWDGVIDRNWSENLLVGYLVNQHGSAPEGLISSLIDFILSQPRNKSQKYYLEFILSPVRHWTLNNITGENLIRCLTLLQLQFLMSQPSTLPKHIRSAFLRHTTQSPDEFEPYSRNLILLSQAEDVPSITHYLEGCNSAIAAEKLWEISPEETVRKLYENDFSDEAIRSLIKACPDIRHHIQLMSHHRNIFSQYEREEWVRSTLPNSGELNETVASVCWADEESKTT